MRDTGQPEVRVPILQEQFAVHPEPLITGRVRIDRAVSEEPAEAAVDLQRETVRFERQMLAEPRVSTDQGAFRDSVIEFTETVERAVVRKVAEVVEEIVVHKDLITTQETIRDSVRKTDVRVSRLPASEGGSYVSGS